MAKTNNNINEMDSLKNLAINFFGSKPSSKIKPKSTDTMDTTFIVQSFNIISNNTAKQVEILSRTNLVVTQIADNIYNIAAKMGAQLTSLKETQESIERQEREKQQKQSAAAEEAAMEQRQAVPADKQEAIRKPDEKGGMFDFLKKGFKLPFKDIIKTIFKGGLSFLKSAGSFLVRGLTLFTNPIGLAVAVIGTIGYGIYKYFTDKEFRSSIDNVFQTAKDFIAEKFGQAKDLFGEYIVNPVVNFLTSVKDKFIDGIIALINAVPDFGLSKVKEIKEKLVGSVSQYKSKPTASQSSNESIPSQTPGASQSKEIPKANDSQPVSSQDQSALDADLTKYVKLASGVNLDGLDPAVKKRLAAVAMEYFNATGQKVQINSAFRDPKEQEELFKKYGSPRAARPGKSKHEVGLAVDINSSDANKMVAMGLFDKYGFKRPIMPSEPWHVEASESKKSSPDNPENPGQAVLVSNEGKPSLPSDGKPVNESQLQSAVPASATPSPSSDSVMAESVKEDQSGTSGSTSSASSVSSASSSSVGSAPVSSSSSSGSEIVSASMNVEAGYSNSNQPQVSNIDNSSSTVNSEGQSTKSSIMSAVADRGSLDKYSFSMT